MDNDQLLIDQFLKNHPDLAVDAIERMSIGEIALYLENTTIDNSRKVLSHMSTYKASKTLEKISFELAVEIMERFPSNLAEAILRACNPAFRKSLLQKLPPETRKYLASTLTYHKKQVGAHIEPAVLTLSENQSIEKALTNIKSAKEIAKPVLFVLDEEKKLVGFVSVNQLLSGDGRKIVGSIANPVPSPIISNMLVKDALENWNDEFVELPVIKGDGLFLGIASRGALNKLTTKNTRKGNLELKTANALGDLYLIGLTGLIGSSDQNPKS